MKKKFLAVFASLFVFGSVSSFAFDWSQCWCNYGGGVEKGDFILHVDVGMGDWLSDLIASSYGYWSTPYMEVGLNYAGSIGKLPFTFGGFVGTQFHGWRNYSPGEDRTWMVLSFGGDIAYHIQLPPEIIDVYTGLRLGGKFAKLFVDIEDNTDFDILYDPYLGANFFFTDSFGLNVELAYENWVRAGLSFKF